MIIAFLHVGTNTQLPTIFVQSAKRHNPGVPVVQVSDHDTPSIDGVSWVERRPGDVGQLLWFRMEAWASFPHAGPAVFCDTDMICIAPLTNELGEYDVALCRREFHREEPILPGHAAKYCPEYDGVPIGEAFPYLGCYSVAASNDFWAECVAVAKTLPPKPRGQWYSEQEALKRVAQSGKFKIKDVPERLVAHLPDIHWDGVTDVQMMHFKGVKRKELMLEVAKVHGYI